MLSSWLTNWRVALPLGMVLLWSVDMHAGGANSSELPWGAPAKSNHGFAASDVDEPLLAVEAEPGAVVGSEAKEAKSAVIRVLDDVKLADELAPGAQIDQMEVAGTVEVSSNGQASVERTECGVDLEGDFTLTGDLSVSLIPCHTQSLAFLLVGEMDANGVMTQVDASTPLAVIAGDIDVSAIVGHLRSRAIPGKSAMIVVLDAGVGSEAGQSPKADATISFDLDADTGLRVDTAPE